MSLRLQITQESPAALDAEALASQWNAAYPDALAISPRVVLWCLQAGSGRTTAVLSASRAGRMVGFAVASTTGAAGVAPVCWIDALAAEPGRNGSAVRAALAGGCEQWARAQGCPEITVGGGPRSLLRGVPSGPDVSRFWQRRGYVVDAGSPRADLALDVARYTPPTDLETFAGVVRTATPRDGDNVQALLEEPAHLRLAGGPEGAPYPALAPLLAEDGRIADLMILWTDDGAQGVVQVVFPDSVWPIEAAYPYDLSRPWAALGLIATGAALPAVAISLLLDAAIRRLHNNGVNSCVAVGAADLELYRPFGFRPHRHWTVMRKRLG